MYLITACWAAQVAFVLPVAYPVNLANFNWTPVTVALVLAGVLLAWFAPGCGARQWYHGKAHTLEDTSVVRGVASHAYIAYTTRTFLSPALLRTPRF